MGRGASEWKEETVDGVVAAEWDNDEATEIDAGSHSMPGILPRPEGTLKGFVGTKTATEYQSVALAVGTTHELTKEDHRNGDTLTNGDYEHGTGQYTNGISTTLTDVQHQTPIAIENFTGQLPPEIEHITFGYIRFSLLVSRLVQETFNGLSNVINNMSDMQVPQSGQDAPLNNNNQQVNGNGNPSSANVQKKLRMLNFASDRRAQFIRILILLRWARQAEAVSKVIDLNVWTKIRLGEYSGCIGWMGELKRRLASLRDPNPDIKNALEVLSLGKASWLPDLGYLPPEPLSSQQLLNTLRRINTLLSIRLNLHEAVPLSFRRFSIADGRVTFHVHDEFEVDLSIAEEDPKSQLYFIDFRFIFSPTPVELPVGGLRDVVESRANDVLKREGLQGLFESLHNFTLTHKLNVLRNQAFELARGYWSEQLKIEAVHRSIVVQYWSNRPGGKSWIEIGLRRGKEPASSYTLSTQRISHIALRWFRGGKEVIDVPITMRSGELSLVDTLKQVISLHTSYIFEQIAAKLSASSLYLGRSLRLKCNSSAKEPMDAFFLIQLTSLKAIKVVQEPASGRFSILPASQLNGRAESELNRLALPATEGASQLAYLRNLVSQEEVETGARIIGWEPVRYLSPDQETVQRLFVRGIQRTKFFRRPSWISHWTLAFTTGLEGDSWWIVEIKEREKTAGPAAGFMLQAAYKIVLSGPEHLVTEPSYSRLANIERTAAGMLSHLVDTRALQLQIPHKIQVSTRENTGSRSGSLLIRFPSKGTPCVMRNSTNIAVPWLEEVVRLTYCGLDPSKCFAIHVAQVHIRQSISKLQDLLATIPSIAFVPGTDNSSEALRFQILVNVGTTLIPVLKDRLRAIALLLDFASTVNSHGLTFKATSLTRLCFNYTNSGSPLKATIHFANDGPKHVSLVKSNPHLRIVDHLNEKLRSQSLAPVISILRITLSLLRTFSAMEARQNSGGIDILTRSDQWYQVRYSDPYELGSFEICLRYKGDTPKWFISEASVKKPDPANEAFEEALRAVTRGKGEGWRGVKGGMFADIQSVGDLVLKLDEVFRTKKYVAGESNPKKRKAEDNIVEID